MNPQLKNKMETANQPTQKTETSAASDSCASPVRPSWRSAAFWHSDIEDLMDRIATEAQLYHPESREKFYNDVLAEIKTHLANEYPKQDTHICAMNRAMNGTCFICGSNT
jgi:hypothetical protein